MGRKYIKIFRNCVLAVICIVLVVFIFIPEYVMCFFSRDFYFREYVKGSEKIYFLGTYHNMTLDSTPYSYLNLKSVIENLRPDLLLIESRPEQLKNGNFADGPGEMLYSHLTANKLGIVVKGVDWWSDSGKNVLNSTNATRDEYINKNILKEIPSHKKVLILMGNAHVTLEEPKLE
ncbi:hypothetical protein CLRAG_17960 [Clostridium ragsdalei P11]|uniref:Uncharacterized protein n=1 Tax=Clostridium ragsdalei P11 TaxID=1353534 RepID=A0A1A6AV30_9CLOT|nr:hypothetical protein [Clostridium ragsdalei]OBR93893.1 hypothetical protein CLRAG_17960 [Clostridium ragsdalei P11]